MERKPEQDKYILREELKSSTNLPQGETRPYDLKDYLRQHNGNFRLEEFENFIKSKEKEYAALVHRQFTGKDIVEIYLLWQLKALGMEWI